MDEELKRQVRVRAHEIWMSEGQPHGRDQEHWDQAVRELAGSGGDAVAAVETEAEASAAGKPGRGGRGKKAAGSSTPAQAGSTAAEGTASRRR